MFFNLKLTICYMLDMVGKVENVQELIKSNKDDDDKTRFKFDISDGRFQI